MSMYYLLGAFCGVAIGGLLAIVLLRFTKKRGNRGKCQYDERQEIVRGRGFKYGFFTIMICNIVIGLLMRGDALKTETWMLFLFAATLLAILVHVCYCIWNDGYFALNEKPRRVMLVFGGIAFLNFAVFGINMLRAKEQGEDSFIWVNLMCGLMFVVIGLILAVKQYGNRREE